MKQLYSFQRLNRKTYHVKNMCTIIIDSPFYKCPPQAINGRAFLLGISKKAICVLLMASTLLLGLFGGNTFCQTGTGLTLVDWNFNGYSNYGNSPQSPNSNNTNVSITGLTRGSGVGTSGTAAANAWGGVSWGAGTSESNSITNGYFATFAITVNSGYAMSFTSIPAYNVRRSTSGPNTGIWQFSTNSTNGVNGTFTDIGSSITWGSTTSSSGNSEPAITLSGISALQNLSAGTTVYFRVVNWSTSGGAATGTWYLNDPSGNSGYDFTVTGSIVSAASITPASTTLTSFSTTYGTASAAQTIAITSSGLTTDISVPAQSGLEYSVGSSPGTYASTATITRNTSINLYIRVADNTAVSTNLNSKTITLTSGSTSATITTAASNTINAKALTLSGLSVAATKVYDGTTTATVSGSATLQSAEAFGSGNSSDGKPYTADVVGISGTAIANYTTRNVGNGITVDYGGLSLTGAAAGNYTLTQGTTTANITAKALTFTGQSALTTKVYDGTTNATVSGSAVLQATEAAGAGATNDGKPYSVDAVSISGTATGAYNSKDVATAVSITYGTGSLALSGSGSGNYTVTLPNNLSASIIAKALSYSGQTATSTKGYDGTTTAIVSGTASLQATEAAGAGTTVDGKPYSVDAVTISGTATATYNSSTVGVGTTISYNIGSLTLSGTGSGNYTITLPTNITSASITKATPSISSTPSATAITLGEALSSSTLSGGVATASAGTVAGNFSFTMPSSVPSSTGIYSAAITFTPTDGTDYNTVSGTINVTVNAPSTPTLTSAILNANLTSTYGTAQSTSSDKAVVYGSALGINTVTATAQTGYQVSLDGSTNWGTTVSFAPTSGTVNSFVYVRFASTLAAGSYNNVVCAVLSCSGATSVNINTTSSNNTISPATLTISTAIIASKTYNGSPTSGTVTPGTLSGFVGAETVTVATATGTYPDAYVANGKTATIVYTLANGTNGGLAANYSLANTTATGNITPVTLFITAATIAPKTYNGLPTSGTVTVGTLSGFVGSETVTVSSATGTYPDANVANGKTATIVYTLSNGTNGGLAANYLLANNTATGNITAATLSITPAIIASKTYNQSATSGTVTAGTLSGFVGSETVTVALATGTYPDANVGTGKTASIVYVLANGANGGLASNYSLANSTATGNITAVPLSITAATIAPKTYDGFLTSGTVTPGTLSGFVGAETVVVSSAVGTYPDGNVGTGKTATIAYTLGNGTNGGLAINYTLANTTATGNIIQASQTITFGALANVTTSTADYSPGATSPTSSINPITYTSSNSAVATIVSGNIHIVGAGTTTITAYEAGSTNYLAASNQMQSLTVASAPVITTSVATLGTLNNIVGTASIAQAFNVYGTNLSANISITPPSGYEVSVTSATTGFGSSQSITQTSGSATGTVWVRIAAATAVGTYGTTGTPENITLTSTTATKNVAVFGTVNNSSGNQTIADWTFETSQPTSSGPFNPESGTQTASAQASGYHSNGSVTYSSPVGNGSSHSFSSNNWTIGDYYQFQVSTTGLNNINFDWNQTGSNTGPADFNLQYSSDGGNTFTTFTSYTIPSGSSSSYSWSSGSTDTHTQFTQSLSSISSINNLSSLYIRLTMKDNNAVYSTLGSSGTNRIDNVTISGSVISSYLTVGGGAVTGLSTTYGTASSTTSFTITGSSLSSAITSSALSGFEFSTDGGVTYNSTINIASANANNTNTVLVRLAKTTLAGTSYGGMLTFTSGSNSATVTIPTSTVNKANLLITGTRVYDGTTSFLGSLLTATGVNGESFAMTGSGITSTKNVQTNQPLSSINSLALGTGSGGALSSNYNAITATNSSVNITKLTVTVNAVTDSKTYDGTTSSTGVPTYVLQTGDVTATAPTQTFNTKNVGTGKTLTPAGLVINDGNSGGNYTIVYATVGTGIINAATLIIATNNQTVCYGTSVAIVQSNGSYTASGFVNGENAGILTGSPTYSTNYTSTSAAGTLGLTITVGGLSAPNYTFNPSAGIILINSSTTITAQPSTSAQILCLNGVPNTLVITAIGANLTYQWYSNTVNSNSGGTGISGATFSSYTPLTTNADTLYYYCVVGGTCTSSVTSNVSGSVSVLSNGTWAGSTTDWAVGNNWCGGVPTSSTNAIIPAGYVSPTITGTSTVNNLTIATGASVMVISGTLQIGGTITNNGTLDATAGTIQLNGTTPQSLPAVFNSSNTIGTLIASNPAGITLGGNLNITNFLHISNGNLNLSNYNITLKSTPTTSGQLGTVSGTITYGGTGRFVSETYINTNRRGYRNIGSGGILSDGSIFANWQEGGSNAPEYGTQITGSIGTGGYNPVSGFDYTRTGQPSLFTYNTSDAFVKIPSTMTPSTNGLMPFVGYYAVLRGDRTYDIFSNNPSLYVATTTLRVKGKVTTGTVTLSSDASPVCTIDGAAVSSNFLLNAHSVSAAQYATTNYGFSLVANPYACAINWGSVFSRSNGSAYSNGHLSPYHWIWNQGINNNVGGWVTVKNDGIVSVKPSETIRYNTQYIQSGESFFILNDNSGSPLKVEFQESDKYVTDATQVKKIFSTPSSAPPHLSISLLRQDSSSLITADGTIVAFGDDYSNLIDINDAGKFANDKENIAILRGEAQLSVECRKTAIGVDSVPLTVWNLTNGKQYGINVSTVEYGSGLAGYLQDKLMGTFTQLPADSSYTAFFTPSADTNTYKHRFAVVFSNPVLLPVTFNHITAGGSPNGNFIDWSVSGNLEGLAYYTVERSKDGKDFVEMGKVVQANNNVNEEYHYLDKSPLGGVNYYRIKAIGNGQSTVYSHVVSVNNVIGSPTISLMGNNIKNGQVRLDVKNLASGEYQVLMFGDDGKKVASQSMVHNGINGYKTLSLPYGDIAKGLYFLHIDNEKGTYLNEKVLVE